MSGTDHEIGLLGSVLGQLVNLPENVQDPILAGGLCVLHNSNRVSCASVESESAESGVLIVLAVALLTALVADERDPRVRAELQRALDATTEAQRVNVTVDDPSRIN